MIKMRLIILISVIGVFSYSICYGQTNLFFNKINRVNGLSNNNINCIEKEVDGFLWIGTKNGLNRYDGYEVKIYNDQNSNLESTDISDILIDQKNRIWVATLGGGLGLYNPDKDDFIIYKRDSENTDSISSNKLNALYEDTKGNLWIATEKGFCLYNENSNSFISWLDKGSYSVTSFLEYNGDLWIGSFGKGLHVYDLNNKTLNKVLYSNSNLNIDFIHCLYQTDNGKILIGTSGSGLLSMDITTKEFSDFLHNISGIQQNVNIVRSIIKDEKGDLWIGTDGNGIINLQKSNKGNFIANNYVHNPQVPSSLSGNAIYDLMEDEDSNLWIGTAWNGINVLDNKGSFEILLSDIKGRNTAPVLSILKTDSQLFMGLDGKGMTIYDINSKRTTYHNKDSKVPFNGNYIQYIMEATDGTFWIGTFTNGLIHFDSKKGIIEQYKHNDNKNSLSYNDVRYIFFQIILINAI